MGFEKIDREDIITCYREIRSASSEIKDKYGKIYLSQEKAPGGYYWIFPMKKTINTGIGVQIKPGFPDPKKNFYSYVVDKPILKSTEIIHSGGWIVATRRPLSKLVGNGVLIVGDAACQVNPMHGGGIGPSITGGRLAAQTVVKAFSKDDFSEKSMWDYAKNYMRKIGAKHAALDIFRIFLQSTTDDELSYGMKKRVLREEDVLRASLEGDIRLSVLEKLGRAVKAPMKPRLLLRLRKAARLMKQAKALYLNYPDPEDFAKWKLKVDTLFSLAKNYFSH